MSKFELRRRASRYRFARHSHRQQARHFANHCQYQPLVSIRQRRAIPLDLRKKPNLILRKFTKHLLRFFIARRFRPGKKVRQ